MTSLAVITSKYIRNSSNNNLAVVIRVNVEKLGKKGDKKDGNGLLAIR